MASKKMNISYKTNIITLNEKFISVCLYVVPILLLFTKYLCYFTYIFPLVIIFVEIKNPFVKKHAIKSFIIQSIYFIITIITIKKMNLLISNIMLSPFPIYWLRLLSLFLPPLLFIITIIYSIYSILCILDCLDPGN